MADIEVKAELKKLGVTMLALVAVATIFTTGFMGYHNWEMGRRADAKRKLSASSGRVIEDSFYTNEKSVLCDSLHFLGQGEGRTWKEIYRYCGRTGEIEKHEPFVVGTRKWRDVRYEGKLGGVVEDEYRGFVNGR